MRAAPPDLSRPVLLAGPTASGKSALALALAQEQGRVIINADALQVYDMWQILSARPSVAEMADVPHYLYGCVGHGQEWSVGHWLRAVAALLATHANPIIVGGTGLYFRALTEGLVEITPIPPHIRAEADMRLAQAGAEALATDLDSATRAQIDLANPARVQRAWEVLCATGKGLAEWQAQTPPPLLPLSQTTPYVLRPQVDWLNSRTDSRFASMMAQGALAEASAALPHWQPRAPWARAIGAAELIAHLQGHISLSQAVADATLATRQYAKRQRTWFRNRMGAWQALL
ncbi:MAG: tRNA (adenosine(37)-N6)-dimethylallyltransferase MiaA [Roseinatronobacter sp.]|nr:tRNA (adenosine(37)-N6)-dimethylallyltransferase MiaA [Roseinatronobacter sp.]